VTVPFTVGKGLAAQFGIVGCASSPCSTRDTLTFIDRSRSSGTATVTGWSWSFGDGTTSTAQDPTHRFAQPGTYDVSLTVTDSAGRTDSTTQSIEVRTPDPDADDDGVPDHLDNCPTAPNPGSPTPTATASVTPAT
jgi:PKD repeat protein